MAQDVTSGYLIVKTFERMYREYLKLREIKLYPLPDDKVIYSIPWKGRPAQAYAKRYRGVSRDPLFRWDDTDEEGFRGTGYVEEPQDAELEAHLALGCLPEIDEDDRTIIGSHEDATHVFSMLKNPVEREVRWVRNADADSGEAPTYPLLGYEPTWGFRSDWFSAVSDCLCFPTWHGTDREGTLFKEHYDRLNQYALFDTPDAARDFIRYYLSFDWTEQGDYVITEVRLAHGSI